MPVLMYRDPNDGQMKPLIGGTRVEDNFQASDEPPTDPNIDLWLDTNDETTGQPVYTMGGPYSAKHVADFLGDPSHTGYLLITLPDVYYSMMNLKVTGYVYSTTSGSFEMMVGGYNYAATPSWVNTSADGTGRFPTGAQYLDVRYLVSGAPDACQYAIAIGSSTQAWSYPNLVLDVMTGHVGKALAGTAGWGMTITNDISGWTVSATKQMYSNRMWQGTKAEYDAITIKDSHIFYVVS